MMPVYLRALCALAMLFCLMTAYGQSHPLIEPGVSLSLAQQRAAVLSGIKYDLAFTIPEDPAADIDGVVLIRFELSDSSQPLQLDFLPHARQRPERERAHADPRPT